MNRINRRTVLARLVAGLGVPVLAACGGGDDASPADPPSVSPASGNESLVVYSYPDDPRIVGGTLVDGTNFIVLGLKAADGAITSARSMAFRDAEGNLETSEFSADSNQLTTISADGTRTTLSPTTGGGWRIGLSAGTQQLELNLPGEAAELMKAAPSFAAPVGAGARQGRALMLQLHEPDCAPCTAEKSRAAAMLNETVNAPIAEIEVTGCTGLKPRVFVRMFDEVGKLLDTSVAKPGGVNLYNAVITTLNSSDEAVAAAAGEVIRLLDSFDITEGAFASMLTKLGNTSVDALTDMFVAYLKSADKWSEAYEQFSIFTGATAEDIEDVQKTAKFKVWIGKALGAAFKTLNVYERLKQAVQAGLTISAIGDASRQYKFNRLQLQAVVITEKGEKFESISTGLIPPEGPYPRLSVNVTGGQVDVSSLSLSPSSPGVGQDYTATGSINCLSAGDVVTIAVTGSDGYSDSVTTTVSGAQGTQSFSLGVPGAASGVRDTVTLRVAREGLQVGIRTATLVFG